MTKLTPAETDTELFILQAEIEYCRNQLNVHKGTRTRAILLANIDINQRKIAAIKSPNVIVVDFGGRK